MLHINDLTYRVAGRTLLEGATAAIPEGHRVALVGRNGTGKSTLLKLIAGELAPDAGSITLPTRCKLGMVRQEVPAGDETLLETVLAADAERTALLAEAETSTDAERLAEVHARLSDIGAHAAESRAARILAGLGFDAEAQAKPCRAFSGGWRMRVALAGVLFAEPDLLLLDEPTNHLDLEATLWLQTYLKTYPRTMIIVSHDRGLLNDVPTTTIHLDQRRLETYAGNYDQFTRQRAAKADLARAAAAKVEARRKHLQSFVDRFKAKATKARQAQSRVKALEKLEVIHVPLEEHGITFSFPEPPPLAPPLLTLDGVTVGYDGRPVLKRLSARIDADDRIALLGANGNGKSTFVKLLAGRLAPMEGEVRRSGKMRVGYFAQHQSEELRLDWTAVQQVQSVMPQATEQQVRAFLGRFGFGQAKADTRVGDLSGGEKARLLIALTAREVPHILLLDEPTNHLDIDSRDALVEALNDYPGAVILISHDPHLVELTADRLWLVAEGTVQPFEGDLDDYRRHLLETRRDADRARRASTGDGRPAPSRQDQRRAAAELRARLAPLKKTVTETEKRMAEVAKRRAALEAQLADPALYANGSGGERILKLQIELGALVKEAEGLEERWLAASLALEEAEAAAQAEDA